MSEEGNKEARERIEDARANKKKRLDLRDLDLTVLPERIFRGIDVQELDLSLNRLWSIPESIGEITNLEALDLRRNEISIFPESLAQLANLRTLDLSQNELTSVPESVGELANLQELYLHENRIAAIPKSLGHLGNLRILTLFDNQIRAIPESLRKLNKLEGLFLHDNPWLGIPAEVLGPTSMESRRVNSTPAKPDGILDYYFKAKATPGRPLNEAKLILLGRGGVGKTSLLTRLLQNQFSPGDTSTEGIEIQKWSIPVGDEEVRLNVWDFGGQEIMHATHQFFLTERSLYLVVLSARDGGEDAEAEYWLKFVESFGANSPVIIVLNKISERPFDLNRNALLVKYPNIREIIRTDSRDRIGLQDLHRVITREVERLDGIHIRIPEEWFAVKDFLASVKENYLHFDRYRELCIRNNIIDKDQQEMLADFLNQLGIILYYKDDPRLKDTQVLNPHWVTNGIYKILNSKTLERNRGEIFLHEVSSILPEKDYPADMCRFIFDLMKKFDLCFSFPDNDSHYLIPELLQKNEPDETASFNKEECLNFQYHYPVLPSGILPKFISRTFRLSEGEARWRDGVILKFEHCRALVKADLVDKKIFISITGNEVESRRRLLALIRADFERIHRDFKNLNPQEMVPLPGLPNEIVSYRDLLVLENKGMTDFPKVVGTEVKNYKISDLLSGVDLPQQNKGDKKDLNLFYVYAHKDESYREQLETHLKILQRQGTIQSWSDREIGAGGSWGEEINAKLNSADIILLLISADFIASDFAYEIEMKRALDRHRRGEAMVIPVIVRDCLWQEAPFSRLQVVPKGGRPVNKWKDRDTAWRIVVEEIERASLKIQKGEIERDSNLIISKITLSNIRCYEEISLSFEDGNQIRDFILLFGDNGTGKSTLLRSIATGLCDVNTATAFMESQPGSLLRHNQNTGEIAIELVSPVKRQDKWTIRTKFRRNRKGEITISQEVFPEDLPREKIFACGYGSSRRGFGSQDYTEYSLRNSLGTLFNYDLSLQNPELALRRMRSQGIGINWLLQKIDAVLTLEPGSTTLDSAGLQINGPWGEFMPVGGLGDGFQATLGWIADMFGWALFHSSNAFDDELSGIVIIDELEQHLHPSWQREIIRLLNEHFPNIQFIASSHSPMCALGLTALKENQSKLFQLNRQENVVTARSAKLPKGQRVDQLLTSSLFGLFSASSFDINAEIEEFTALSARENRTNEQDARLDHLDEKLKSVFGPYRNELEEKVDKAVTVALEKELVAVLESGELRKDSIDFAVRNRLNNLFGRDA